MENVTQKRTPGNGESCFLRRNLKKPMNMGAMTLGRFIRRRGQTLHSGPRRQSGQSFCCIGQEAQREGAKAEPFDRTEAVRTEKGVFRVHKSGDLSGVYYTWLVTADGQTQETADPYAKAAGVNGQRSMVIDLKKAEPEGWDKGSGEAAKGSGTRCLGSACRRFFPRSPKRCFGRKSREI